MHAGCRDCSASVVPAGVEAHSGMATRTSKENVQTVAVPPRTASRASGAHARSVRQQQRPTAGPTDRPPPARFALPQEPARLASGICAEQCFQNDGYPYWCQGTEAAVPLLHSTALETTPETCMHPIAISLSFGQTQNRRITLQLKKTPQIERSPKHSWRTGVCPSNDRNPLRLQDLDTTSRPFLIQNSLGFNSWQ